MTRDEWMLESGTMRAPAGRFAAIRGLAYMTIDELSEVSGVPACKLRGVEDGLYDLTIDEALSVSDAMDVKVSFLYRTAESAPLDMRCAALRRDVASAGAVGDGDGLVEVGATKSPV